MIAVGSLIQATALWGYRELVHSLGADPNVFLTRFGIPRGADAEEDGFIPFAAFVEMLEATADDLDCPDFGLRLSQWRGLEVLGPVSVIARNSQTVLKSVDAVARYLHVHSPAMRLTRVPDGEASAATGNVTTDAAFAFTLTEPGLPPVLQGYELSMAAAVRILHVLGGSDAAPSSISFPHEQNGPDTAYREVLGCPVKFAQTWCGFELSAELAEHPIAGADAATRRMARKYLDARYIPPTAPLAARVADLAHNLLPTGECSVDAIAAELAMPVRTLQRRLADESTSCQDVIERERRDLAARYLVNPDLPLSHVASLIGYTEQSALNRSCRRWFGMTPRKYRMTRRDEVLAP